MESFDSSVIERHEAELEEASERNAVVEQVANRLAELARRWFVALVDFRPCNELVEHGLAPLLTHSELGVRIAIANLVFDFVELLVRGEGQCRTCIARIESLYIISSRVHVATTLDQLAVVLEARVEQVRSVGHGRALAQGEDVFGQGGSDPERSTVRALDLGPRGGGAIVLVISQEEDQARWHAM